MSADLLEFDRLLGFAIQYAQSLIAMYSLLPGPFERRTVHQTYMVPVRTHLNLVSTKLVALLTKAHTFITYASSLDGNNFFLAQPLQVLVYYTTLFAQTAQTHGANMERTVALMADDRIAPPPPPPAGNNNNNPPDPYARHPDTTLPHVTDARKRLTQKALWTRAAVRPLTYLSASSRGRVLDAVQRWSAILVNHRRQRDLRARGGVDQRQFPGLFNSAVAWGASPPVSPAAGGGPTGGGSRGNAAQVFAINWANMQGT